MLENCSLEKRSQTRILWIILKERILVDSVSSDDAKKLIELLFLADQAGFDISREARLDTKIVQGMAEETSSKESRFNNIDCMSFLFYEYRSCDTPSRRTDCTVRTCLFCLLALHHRRVIFFAFFQMVMSTPTSTDENRTGWDTRVSFCCSVSAVWTAVGCFDRPTNLSEGGMYVSYRCRTLSRHKLHLKNTHDFFTSFHFWRGEQICVTMLSIIDKVLWPSARGVVWACCCRAFVDLCCGHCVFDELFEICCA